MRNNILNFIRKELIGPDPVKPHIQVNGEEILLNEPPRIRYSAGILFPRSTNVIISDSSSEEEKNIIEKTEKGGTDTDPVNIGNNKPVPDSAEDFEEEIGLANSFLPSAMGFSCFSLIPEGGFVIKINAAKYEIREYSYVKEDGTPFTKKAYYRIPLDQEVIIPASEIPLKSGTTYDLMLKDKDGKDINLKLNIRNRTHSDENNIHLLTFTLINMNEGGTDNINNEDCFFQISFSVHSDILSFCPYRTATSMADKDDEKSNLLLYRKKKTFAVGHGCSPSWSDNDAETTDKITADTL